MAKTPEQIDRVIEFVRNDDIDCCHLCPCGQNEKVITGLPDGQCSRANDIKMLDWCEKNKPEIVYSLAEKTFDLFCGRIWKRGSTYRGVIYKAMKEVK